MEEVYTWFHEASDLVHRYLEAANTQVAEAVSGMLRDGMGPAFHTWAHEMFIPPWMGVRLFDEFVVPYDTKVNAAIHAGGARLRNHCHGCCMGLLERFADMGNDAVEPLEMPPRGDVDLAEARRLVGAGSARERRMLLSGNVASETFVSILPEEVRRQAREAIRAGAPGGGFTLRTSGGCPDFSPEMSDAVVARVIDNCEAYMLAGLEYGRYPIRL